MMARVTVEEVMSIMDMRVQADKVPPFIDTASLIINTKVVPAYENEQDGEALLKQIELYYTAHLLTVTLYHTEVKLKGLDTETEYVNRFDKGLDSSFYGQTLKTLDYKKALINLEKSKATIASINTLAGVWSK